MNKVHYQLHFNCEIIKTFSFTCTKCICSESCLLRIQPAGDIKTNQFYTSASISNFSIFVLNSACFKIIIHAFMLPFKLPVATHNHSILRTKYNRVLFLKLHLLYTIITHQTSIKWSQVAIVLHGSNTYQYGGVVMCSIYLLRR